MLIPNWYFISLFTPFQSWSLRFDEICLYVRLISVETSNLGITSLFFLSENIIGAMSLFHFQVEENKVDSIKRDKAATEKLLQETIEKHQAELAAQKEFYTNALNAAKEAEALAEARANNEARTELDNRLRQAEEREAMLVQTLEELRTTLSRKEQQVGIWGMIGGFVFGPAKKKKIVLNHLLMSQAVFREDMLRRDIEDLQKRYQVSCSIFTVLIVF